MDGSGALQALVVDDEAPAREELAFLLREDPRVGTVVVAASAGEALRRLGESAIDVVFCDIKMPGLDGVELARVMSRFARRPQIVFVTAYDDHAVDAFELQAADYVMKPVRAERIAEAVRRVVGAEPPSTADETISVELAGVTRFVRRSQVLFVEAHGDYARLYTADGSHLVRTPLSVLEERWADAGFVRIHRSVLAAIAHIDEVRVADGRTTVRVGTGELPVSRRHARALRDRLAGRG
ncbi:MAG: response regulator transcription factor [Jatrophihabitans sp.]|nr:MAG: response regulator transcription factor [Jatrophihabitans sp.]